VLIAFVRAIIRERPASAPVAIAGAVMVGLGFKPFQSAVLISCQHARSPGGAIGTPIVTLAPLAAGPTHALCHAGHQLPFVSILVPFWLVPFS
jgi:lactate permease